jgi:hypothetical protein
MPRRFFVFDVKTGRDYDQEPMPLLAVKDFIAMDEAHHIKTYAVVWYREDAPSQESYPDGYTVRQGKAHDNLTGVEVALYDWLSYETATYGS